jgi:hypothetical protein
MPARGTPADPDFRRPISRALLHQGLASLRVAVTVETLARGLQAPQTPEPTIFWGTQRGLTAASTPVAAPELALQLKHAMALEGGVEEVTERRVST